jgi:DNA-binding transcriptional regulator GbsR (MarR family)
MWLVVRQIITERKKRELEPMLKVLEEVSTIHGSGPEVEEFTKVVSDIKMFSHKANQTLDVLTKSDSNWFTNVFLRFLK